MLTKTLAALALCAGTAQGAIELHGSGTTNPSKFFWEVMDIFEARAKPGVRMSYRAVGSGTGQYEFLGKENTPKYATWDQDFGSGDIPISTTDYAELTDAGIEMMHIPFQTGAMSFFHNVPADVAPAGGLKLTACLLARIFKRDITTWDHADIMAENPTFSVPAGEPIMVFHRVLGSSTTGGITTYLRSACPAVWPQDMVGSVVEWPADTLPAQGSSVMSSSISSTPYSIGYIDAGHGHDDMLTEIELANKAGVFRNSKQAAEVDGVANAAAKALEAGVLPADPTADFSQVSLHNMDGEDVWPIVAVSYAYVRKDLSAMGEKACLLKAFLQYIVSEEGQALLPRYNAVGIPAAVKAVADKAIADLTMPAGADACTEWSFEGAKSTIKGAGQADYVVSGKRRDFSEYDRNDLHGELVAMLAAMEMEYHGGVVSPTGSSIDVVPEGGAGTAVVATGSDPMSVVGLISGLLGLVVSLLAYRKAGQGKATYGGVEMQGTTAV